MHTIVETPGFSRDALKILGAEALGDLLAYVALRPDCGDLIQGSGGFRKLRWGKANRGKSGGVRTIHFYHTKSQPI